MPNLGMSTSFWASTQFGRRPCNRFTLRLISVSLCCRLGVGWPITAVEEIIYVGCRSALSKIGLKMRRIHGSYKSK